MLKYLTSLIFVTASALIFADQPKVLEYKLDNHKYMIIVLLEKNIPTDKAKEIAKSHAGQIAKNNNADSYRVVTEDEVIIMLGKENWPNPYDYPQNLYQDEIINKGYNREQFVEDGIQDTQPHDAYRMIIELT